MKNKNILTKLFWSTVSSKAEIERKQKRIRDVEWDAVKSYIPIGCRLLDVGCGAGDNMLRALTELKCDCEGIDPEPGAHGVGRYHGLNEISITNKIQQATAESIPFPDNTFDCVFCSHVLEHVNNEELSLKEMRRVLKPGGILVIGMPTATVAWITWFSSYVFTTHISILFFLKSIGKSDMLLRLRRVFIPDSHSRPRAVTIFYDVWMYRVGRWKKAIGFVFSDFTAEIKPALYSLPDYPSFFPFITRFFLSSSVFFIVKKNDF
jgi:SAM-dependent methyltransferase